jgi:endonuclease/exonuclease/phosphatase (EEP) superfamily protein YafD
MKPNRWVQIRVIVSVVGCLLLAAAYLFRSDSFYAATIWPPFIYAIPGIALLIYRNKKRRWIPLTLWLVFACVFSEEPRMVVRGWVPYPARPANGIRVVTLNCASSIDAAQEIAQWKPDLMFCQESPDEKELAVLARRLFKDQGAVLSGADASIIANGRLEELQRSHRELNHIVAKWTPPGQKPLNVMSLRLTPPVFRIDYFNPDCWRAYAENRKARRNELKELWQQIPHPSTEAPLIMGGDFNSPPDPGVFQSISSTMTDTFDQVGRGWPGTAINEYPFARIDQIWVSQEFKPICGWVVKTVYSDHRMVVMDIQRR